MKFISRSQDTFIIEYFALASNDKLGVAVYGIDADGDICTDSDFGIKHLDYIKEYCDELTLPYKASRASDYDDPELRGVLKLVDMQLKIGPLNDADAVAFRLTYNDSIFV